MTELEKEEHAVVIMSGGLDSTVALYYAIDLGYTPHVMSFNYGQRHVRELDFAARTCFELKVEHEIVDLIPLRRLLSSALTFKSDVPEGHYAQESMKATIVPNRNAIMLSLAYGWALSLGAKEIFCGAHAGDHAIYPDCRPEFFEQLQKALNTGNAWNQEIYINTPFIHLNKKSIVELGVFYDVPMKDTWSCYNSGKIHCGRCGTCVERAEAFALAKVPDPTEYADPDYWRTAVKHGA